MTAPSTTAQPTTRGPRWRTRRGLRLIAHQPQPRARTTIRALFFCLALACTSAHGSRTEVQVGLALLDFDYKEFSESGVLLDREQGWLPGFLIELAQTEGDWRLSGTWRAFS